MYVTESNASNDNDNIKPIIKVEDKPIRQSVILN